MYITKVRLENIRCFKDETIDIGKDGQSFLISGNNSSGKSAILRSIAMGVCDEVSVGALLRDLQGSFIKEGTSKDGSTAHITIDFVDGKNTYKIRTRIYKKKTEIERVTQATFKNNKEIPWDDFPWNKIFITGYGAGLRTNGSEEYSEYFSPDAVYTLFVYTQELQNPELAWRRLQAFAQVDLEKEKKNIYRKYKKYIPEVWGAHDYESFYNVLTVISDRVGSLDTKKISIAGSPMAEFGLPNNIDKILIQHSKINQNSSAPSVDRWIEGLLKKLLKLKSKDKVTLENNGIFIESTWGKQELSTLGDGLRAMTTIVLDFLSWQMLWQSTYENKINSLTSVDFSDFTGIVIIDEIEKHLHPELQREIIGNLCDLFPKVQFILSTHSPLCVSGTADVEKGFSIFSTTSEENSDRKIIKKNVPIGYRADQVLVDYFGLSTTISPSIEQKFKRLRELSFKEKNKNLSTVEKQEKRALDKELRSRSPGLYEKEEDREIAKESSDRIKILLKLLENTKP